MEQTVQRTSRLHPTAAWAAVSITVLNLLMSVFCVLLAVLNGLRGIKLFDPGAIIGITFSLVGVIVASRRRRNPLGWIFLAIGSFQALVAFAYQYAVYGLITQPGSLAAGPLMSILGNTFWIPGLHLMLTYALLLFPTGKPSSPRWRIVAWASAVPLLLFLLLAAWAWPARGRAFIEHPERFNPTGGLALWIGSIMVLLMGLTGLASAVSLVVRFWRSQGIERQQLKWFTFAAVFTVIVVVFNNIFSEQLGLFGIYLGLLAIPSMPIGAGIAILRYRLWDIDVIIRKTLVWGLLTALLGLVYFGGVVAMQQLFRALTGQESPLAIIFSTLAIAALFNALLKRVQELVDRRFYRRKYNAEQVLASFSALAREEVDLEEISARLLDVVEETVQPEHASLWLKPAVSGRKPAIGGAKE